ncbi:MAG: DinB family protein [Intrasporangiaceae bacterium]|nr:DinB family protein [Intrasporangiaceae bacterium]
MASDDTTPTGREFENEDLSGSRFEMVRLNDSQFSQVRFDGSRFQNISWHNVTMSSVELVDVEIGGDVWNLRINGVDIGPLIDAELNRRDPDRHLVFQELRESRSVEDYRKGWGVIEHRWTELIDRVRELPEGSEHRSVAGEWSLVQTLRHISYAVAAWIERVALGVEDPFVDTDLPWDEAPADIPRPVDRDARIALDDAVGVWRRRQQTVRDFLESLTTEDLERTVSTAGDSWPQVTDFPLAEAVHIAVTEVWEHHQFAQRDLHAIEQEQAQD